MRPAMWPFDRSPWRYFTPIAEHDQEIEEPLEVQIDDVLRQM
jgi:hypothetical protein